MPDDRASQIGARLAAAETDQEWLSGDALTDHITACDILASSAPADLAWLLAERAELLRRVEVAERAELKQVVHAGVEELKAAQRAGAVKALREAAFAEPIAAAKWLLNERA